MLQREVDVRKGLCLHALRRVDDEECALARGKAARDLVVEVDVPRCVDQVQLIQLTVLAAIVEADGLRLDGDAALALEVHAVEHLRLHLTLTECACVLDEAVGDGGFSVVDVGDDGKIADMLLIHCVSLSPSLLLLYNHIEHVALRVCDENLNLSAFGCEFRA